MDVSHREYSTDWACAVQGSKEEVEARDKKNAATLAERRKKAEEYREAEVLKQAEAEAKKDQPAAKKQKIRGGDHVLGGAFPAPVPGKALG